MAQNFLSCDREQELLLPPSLREWLGEDHVAWFVLDAVEAMDLTEFYGVCRADGHGRAAHDPAMMVALLLYSYALGERSSRAIERRCRDDVPTRVICANRAPDHTTISRFRARHEEALAGTFTQILAMCAKAGLVSVGVVALDGTLMAANAARSATRTHESIREEVDRMLGEAAAVDAAEVGLAVTSLQEAGVEDRLGTVLADGGYWNSPQITRLGQDGIVAIVPTRATTRTNARELSPRQGPEAERIDAVLETPEGAALYRKRQHMIEPVFGNTKFNRRIARFHRRGLPACRAEWRLIAATHNLLKLYRTRTVAHAA